MIKYDNLIYLTICEESLKQFSKKSLSVTYVGYCRALNYAITDNNLSDIEAKNMSDILEKIKFLYSLEYGDAADYLLRYFKKDNLINYERAVRISKNIFPESFK